VAFPWDETLAVHGIPILLWVQWKVSKAINLHVSCTECPLNMTCSTTGWDRSVIVIDFLWWYQLKRKWSIVSMSCFHLFNTCTRNFSEFCTQSCISICAHPKSLKYRTGSALVPAAFVPNLLILSQGGLHTLVIQLSQLLHEEGWIMSCHDLPFWAKVQRVHSLPKDGRNTWLQRTHQCHWKGWQSVSCNFLAICSKQRHTGTAHKAIRNEPLHSTS